MTTADGGDELERAKNAARLRERLEGIADAVSLTHSRAPDSEQWAAVVAEPRRPPT